LTPAEPATSLRKPASGYSAFRAAEAETSQVQAGPQGRSDHPLNDLQQSILAATGELRRRGHPPNEP